MHPALSAIASATLGTQYEGQLWLVGGAVRDELLGRPVSSDFDIVLEDSAQELAAFLYKKGLSKLEPVTYARFGTAMVRVEGINVELATARKESYAEDSRKPVVEPATLLEDARRRDFTVNALMLNLHSGKQVDLLGNGMQDLQHKILRTPLDPVATFRDDPLRMLRAIRFRWKLGFTPAPGLYDAIRQEADRLDIISEERIQEELVKMLALADADKCFRDLLETNLLAQFAPELVAMVGVEQGKYHHLDVWEHTLLVLKNAGTGDLVLSLAALLHDVGKPVTRSIDARGNTRFFSHETVGADMAANLLRRLKFSKDVIDDVHLLVRNHMRLGSSPKFTSSAARRVIRDLGPNLERFLNLVDADSRGLKRGVRVMNMDAIKAKLADVQAVTPASKLVSPLTGEEIMAILGVPEGPQVGKAKTLLTERVLDGFLDPEDKSGAKAILLDQVIQ